MVVPRKPKGKPNALDETIRVIRILNLLAGETLPTGITADTLLIVADRIAARTED